MPVISNDELRFKFGDLTSVGFPKFNMGFTQGLEETVAKIPGGPDRLNFYGQLITEDDRKAFIDTMTIYNKEKYRQQKIRDARENIRHLLRKQWLKEKDDLFRDVKNKAIPPERTESHDDLDKLIARSPSPSRLSSVASTGGNKKNKLNKKRRGGGDEVNDTIKDFDYEIANAIRKHPATQELKVIGYNDSTSKSTVESSGDNDLTNIKNNLEKNYKKLQGLTYDTKLDDYDDDDDGDDDNDDSVETALSAKPSAKPVVTLPAAVTASAAPAAAPAAVPAAAPAAAPAPAPAPAAPSPVPVAATLPAPKLEPAAAPAPVPAVPAAAPAPLVAPAAAATTPAQAPPVAPAAPKPAVEPVPAAPVEKAAIEQAEVQKIKESLLQLKGGVTKLTEFAKDQKQQEEQRESARRDALEKQREEEEKAESDRKAAEEDKKAAEVAREIDRRTHDLEGGFRGGGKSLKEEMKNLNALTQLENDSGKPGKQLKEEFVEELDEDPVLTYKNDAINSTDRLIFIIGTYFIRIIVLFIIEWAISSYQVTTFKQAYISYILGYIGIFMIWVLLANIRETPYQENVVFSTLFYYINLKNKYSTFRIVLHCLVQIILLPLLYIIKYKANPISQDSFEQKQQLMKALSNFTFFMWLMTTIIATRF